MIMKQKNKVVKMIKHLENRSVFFEKSLEIWRISKKIATFGGLILASSIYADTKEGKQPNNNGDISLKHSAKQNSDDSATAISSSANNIISRIKTNVKDLKSERGVRFFYGYDDGAPIVHIRVAFKNSGAAYQSKEKAGIAAFYARTVFKGCGKYSPASFDKAVSDLASNIFCDSTQDITTFGLDVPKVVLDEVVELFNLAISDPKFEEDKVKIVKDFFVGFLRDYSCASKEIAFAEIIPSIIFKGHPYERGGAGDAEDFAKLSIDDLKNFKNKYIVAKNAEVCVFGDISETEAANLVDKVFKNVPDGSEVPDNIPQVSPKLEKMEKRFYVPGPQSKVFFVLKFVRPKAKDIAAAEIVSTVLGGPILTKSKILGILRGKLGYIYTGIVTEVHKQHADYLVGSLLTDNNKVSKAIDALKKIIKDLRENGITKDELDFAKGFINGSTLVGLRTSGSLCDFYFSELLKGQDVDALEKFLIGISGVTLEDVCEYCRKNLDENAIPFIIIGGNPEEQIPEDHAMREDEQGANHQVDQSESISSEGNMK